MGMTIYSGVAKDVMQAYSNAKDLKDIGDKLGVGDLVVGGKMTNKDKCTFIVSLYEHKGAKAHKKIVKKKITGTELLEICSDLMKR